MLFYRALVEYYCSSKNMITAVIMLVYYIDTELQ